MSKRRPSMRDVAREAGVSVSAVALVAHDRPGVAAETRKRIKATMARLGYVMAEGTGNGQSRTVGLLIEKSSRPALMDIFYGDVIRGLQTEAQALGYHVLLHMVDRDLENPEGLREYLAGRIEGLVVANDGDISQEMVLQLRALELPIVLIENHIPDQPFPSVLGDNFVAGHTATRHLLSLGHRKLAVLRGSAKYSSLMDRLRGCLAAAAEERLLIPQGYLPEPTSGHPQKGYQQMCQLLQLPDRPTAVVAISDKTAFGAIEAIKEAGLRIPEDIALASIDDVADSAYTRPALTTVHIPRHEMGVLAMQQLQRMINHDVGIPVKTVVYGRLVVRESCGAGVQVEAERSLAAS